MSVNGCVPAYCVCLCLFQLDCLHLGFKKGLHTLPKRMAQVCELTRFGGKTSQELADELHISKRTVEYHLLVSRREIRQALQGLVPGVIITRNSSAPTITVLVLQRRFEDVPRKKAHPLSLCGTK